MEMLMKPAEYARKLGISRQAVYAKIKKGILTVKEVEGKLYIVVDNMLAAEAAPPASSSPVSQSRPSSSSSLKNRTLSDEYQKLLAAKDETIAVLRGTVEDLKESNQQISTTLKGEIDLLKSAFSEMRSLYLQRIDQMKRSQRAYIKENTLEADVKTSQQAEVIGEWISAKRFLKQHQRIKEKEKILKRLKKAHRRGDTRICKIDGKLKIDAAKNYEDILN